jgi:hypothetical protein
MKISSSTPIGGRQPSFTARSTATTQNNARGSMRAWCSNASKQSDRSPIGGVTVCKTDRFAFCINWHSEKTGEIDLYCVNRLSVNSERRRLLVSVDRSEELAPAPTLTRVCRPRAGSVVCQPIEQSGGHLGITEDARPFTEVEVGGDDDRGAFVEPANKVEQELAALHRPSA